MQLLKASLASWFSVTGIFLIALVCDGIGLGFTEMGGNIAFVALVAFVVAVYFALVGLPLLYRLLSKPIVTRMSFVLTGFLASIPMLTLTVYAGEFEFVIATIVAGVLAGYVYSLFLCGRSST